MTNLPPNERPAANSENPSQIATSGKNTLQVGRDYRNTTNFNFVFFLIGILALGGLAWGLYVGQISDPNNTQTTPAPSQPVDQPKNQSP